MADKLESWTGPYHYSELLFHEQNKALAINSPLEPGYVPGASYMLSDQGNVKLWQRPERRVCNKDGYHATPEAAALVARMNAQPA